jgi:DNA-binding response OmpR family regulator
MRVLLVEDTDDLRSLFARLLRLDGFIVREAEGGESALASLGEFAPDLVLTDLMMPAMDGVEMIRRMRGTPGGEGVPVVAMTACGSRAVERRALDAGAAEVLTKPLTGETLAARLSAYAGAIG